jgi:hypothetical protein
VGEFTSDYLPDSGSRHGPISHDDFENQELPGHSHPILEEGRGEGIMRILVSSDPVNKYDKTIELRRPTGSRRDCPIRFLFGHRQYALKQ